MSFHKGDFAVRYTQMGDEAEAQFEATYENGWVRFGLNRPNISLGMIPSMLRHTPDYLTSHGFVEAVGVGRDRKLKLKIEKALALQQWHTIFPLRLFVWDSKLKQSRMIEWTELWPALPTLPIGFFPEGKAYWAVDVDLM